MFAVVGQPTTETITVRNLTGPEVRQIQRLLYSEHQIEVTTVTVKGWGPSRRYELGAERFSMAARRFLEPHMAEPIAVGRHRTTGSAIKPSASPGQVRDRASAQGAVNRLVIQR